jgi:uncharacterized protein (TIGR02453 family)
MSSEFTGFRPAGQRFLGALQRNNDRQWFDKNKHIYESELREPLAALVEEMDVRFAAFAPEIIGDPKRSLFRIHRDVRFSKDKSPYKTNVACWFFHRDAGRGVGASTPHGGAGFYFHMEAKRASIGAGIWMPPRPTLQKIRDVIAENHRGLTRVLTEPAFKKQFGTLDEENMLMRMPRGYADSHPASALLRHQSFTVGRELSGRELHGAKLPDLLARDYARMLPFVRWLNGALGLRTLARR